MVHLTALQNLMSLIIIYNKTMTAVKKGQDFLEKKLKFKNTSERIEASREVKSIILGINELYKTNKDQSLMDLMKELTLIKQKIEKRLKGRPLTS